MTHKATKGIYRRFQDEFTAFTNFNLSHKLKLNILVKLNKLKLNFLLSACSNLTDYPFLESWIVELTNDHKCNRLCFFLFIFKSRSAIDSCLVLSSNSIKTIISMATYVFNTSQEIDTERKRLIIHIKTPKIRDV